LARLGDGLALVVGCLVGLGHVVMFAALAGIAANGVGVVGPEGEIEARDALLAGQAFEGIGGEPAGLKPRADLGLGLFSGNLEGEQGVGGHQRVGGFGLVDDVGAAERARPGNFGRFEGHHAAAGGALNLEGLSREGAKMGVAGEGQKLLERVRGDRGGGGGGHGFGVPAVGALEETLGRVECHDGATAGTLEPLGLRGRRIGLHATAEPRRIRSRTWRAAGWTGRN
jgi:hypothetical protein